MAKNSINRSVGNKVKKQGEIRVIGGKFRGRKLPVVALTGLRPTSDRVKETVFNWLQFDIGGSRCLDVFAGSGALGFEALSRGAKEVVFLEKSLEAVSQLKCNSDFLKLSNAEILLTDSLSFLQTSPERDFDIVFIDPPFKQNLMPDTLDLLFSNRWINEQSWLYLEQEKDLEWPVLPSGWICYREKATSQVKYGIFKFSQEES